MQNGICSYMALTGDLYEAVVKIVDQRVGEIKVTREGFDRLTKTVSELAVTVQELGEAQKRTEFVLSNLGERVSRLDAAVERLADAQKRTEVVVASLGERVGSLEAAVERLADAQKRTEETVRELAKAAGGLSDTVGYGLEDVARVMLPPWLERHERVRVEELERRFMQADGESVEVNLYGEGLKGRRSITVVGEARSRIHAGDVKEFAERLEKIRKALEGRKTLPLMFGYWIHPTAQSLAKTLRIRLVASYQR